MTPFVKICGIRTMNDALLAADLGAAAVGFIFWPGSPRFVDPYRARPIVRRLPPFVVPVGVFVDQPIEHVCAVARLVHLGAVQLHGQERPESYARCGEHVIKAVALAPDVDIEALIGGVPETATVLLDAHDPVRRGGTGRTIDWTVAAAVARQRRTILSGGLTPDNIGDAIAAVRPYGVDVSSGVESTPGVKDADKLRRFFAAVTAVPADPVRSSSNPR